MYDGTGGIAKLLAEFPGYWYFGVLLVVRLDLAYLKSLKDSIIRGNSRKNFAVM